MFLSKLENRFPNASINVCWVDISSSVKDFQDLLYSNSYSKSGLFYLWTSRTNLISMLKKSRNLSDSKNYQLALEHTIHRNLRSGGFSLVSELAAAYFYGGCYSGKSKITAGECILEVEKFVGNIFHNSVEDGITEILKIEGVYSKIIFTLFPERKQIFLLELTDSD